MINSLKTYERKLEKSEIDEIIFCLNEYQKLKTLKEDLNLKHSQIRTGLRAVEEFLNLEYFSASSEWINHTSRLPHKVIELSGMSYIIKEAIEFIEEAGREEGTVYPDKLKEFVDDEEDDD